MPAPVIPAGGTSPAGLFVPVLYVEPDEPIAMLADPIDFETGELLSIERGFHPVDADVITSLRTERATGSAVQDVGQRFRDMTHIDEKSPAFIREETRIALQHLLDAREVELSITPVAEGDTGELQLAYKNLARRDDERPLALGQLMGGS
jgi:hypothetical protein